MNNLRVTSRFIYSFTHVCVSVRVAITSILTFWPEKGIRFPRAGALGDCTPPNMDAGS